MGYMWKRDDGWRGTGKGRSFGRRIEERTPFCLPPASDCLTSAIPNCAVPPTRLSIGSRRLRRGHGGEYGQWCMWHARTKRRGHTRKKHLSRHGDVAAARSLRPLTLAAPRRAACV